MTQGRAAFDDLGLAHSDILAAGPDTHVLLWRGGAMVSVVAVALTAAGFECQAHDLGVTLPDTTTAEAAQVLRQLTQPLATEDLASFVKTFETGKYDALAPPELLRSLWARANSPLCAALPELIADLRIPPN